ncbi:hypothetical protein L7F22_030899 [Adiantum nelumboides]|nr:hypothetical protein [Adiantum nelumboides]
MSSSKHTKVPISDPDSDSDQEALELDTFLPKNQNQNQDIESIPLSSTSTSKRRKSKSRRKDSNDSTTSSLQEEIDGLLDQRREKENDDDDEEEDPVETELESLRPSFSSYFIILVSLPIGRWLAKILPAKEIGIRGLTFNLNPGPFSIKEHLLIAVLSSSAATSAYASDILNIQSLFFHQEMGSLSGLTLLLTTQILGFGFAGLAHRLLVVPPAMIWPSTLVTCSLFHTLHAKKSIETRDRTRFFTLAFGAVLIYQFLPSLFIPTLSSIAILCIFNNQSHVSQVLSSGYKGFGILNISLDWNAIGSSGPLYQPWWAALNFYSGISLMMYIIMPIAYFGFNFWKAKEFPSALNSGLYDSEYKKFDVDSVMDDTNSLDLAKWKEKGPIYLTPFFALTYGISFAILTSMCTHVVLWHWKDFNRAFFHPESEDAHNRLMKAYQPVPSSWYILTLVLSMTAAIILVATSPLQLPIWGLFLAVFIGLIFLVPVGLIRAVSDTSIGLNVITEFVAGYLLPGKPIANVTFKCLGYMTLAQALDLVSDLKLGHYLKIPPRHMFITQLTGTAIGCIVNLAVVQFVLSESSGYRGYLDGSVVDPTGQWDGRKVHIFYSASIIWGAIGPAKFFGGQYHVLYYGFIIGLLLPILPWILHKRFGSKTIAWNKIAFPNLSSWRFNSSSNSY